MNVNNVCRGSVTGGLTEVSPVTLNTERCSETIDKIVLVVEKYLPDIRHKQWAIGKEISDLVFDMNPIEVIHCFNEVSRRTDLEPWTLSEYLKFYNNFPNLPKIIQKTSIPITWFWGLRRYKFDRYLFEEEVLKMTRSDFECLEDFRYWCRTTVGINIKAGLIHNCYFCSQELIYKNKGEEWVFIPTCLDCINRKSEEINKAITSVSEAKKRERVQSQREKIMRRRINKQEEEIKALKIMCRELGGEV